MSNLTSTVPGAFNALYNLLVTAGNAQSTPIPVFHSEVLEGQQTQNGYVLLESVQHHTFEVAALGSFAQYEDYDICGEVVYYAGGPDPTTLYENVLNATWSIYQAVVMATVVANRGANGTNVLGSSAPTALEWIKPVDARYAGDAGDIGGDMGGFRGVIEFTYNLHARITVP